MKIFYKITGIVAAIALVFGIAFCIVGWSLGGTVEAAEGLVRIPGFHMDFPEIWFGPESDGEEGRNDMAETYPDTIEKLEWEIEYGSVTVQTGEDFSIRAKNLYKEGFESYIDDETWYLECHREKKKTDWELELSEEDAQLVITIPEDVVLEQAVINLGAGVATFDGMTFEEADFEIGAGTVQLHNITVQDESNISVGMGELIMKHFNGKNTTIESGMGNVDATGTLRGDSDITCGIGDIHLKLEASEEDYNYEVTCGIGSVEIGADRSYSGVTDKEIDNDAEDTMYLDCGIGSMELEFEDE